MQTITMYKVIKNNRSQVGSLHGNFQVAEREKIRLKQSLTKDNFKVVPVEIKK